MTDPVSHQPATSALNNTLSLFPWPQLSANRSVDSWKEEGIWLIQKLPSKRYRLSHTLNKTGFTTHPPNISAHQWSEQCYLWKTMALLELIAADCGSEVPFDSRCIPYYSKQKFRWCCANSTVCTPKIVFWIKIQWLYRHINKGMTMAWTTENYNIKNRN